MTNPALVQKQISIAKEKPFMVRVRQQWPTLLMLAPALILIFIFNTVPLSGLYMAFTRYKIADGIFGSKFVGLDNFVRFFKNGSDLGYLLCNTLVVNLLYLLTSIVLAVSFAILLREIRWRPFAKIIQTVSFFPYFISWVITYSVVNSLFAVRTGAFNIVLKDMGLVKNGINLLGSADNAWGLTVTLFNWKSMGYESVLYIAAMSGIAPELYEAASIDGAGRFRKIWHITLPGIIPTICILLILAVGNILNSGIDYFFVFQNSTNWQKMEMFDMYIYNRGLKNGDFSYATAVGIMKSIVSIALLTGANYTTKTLTGSSIF